MGSHSIAYSGPFTPASWRPLQPLSLVLHPSWLSSQPRKQEPLLDLDQGTGLSPSSVPVPVPGPPFPADQPHQISVLSLDAGAEAELRTGLSGAGAICSPGWRPCGR